jgi:hypothetical protein
MSAQVERDVPSMVAEQGMIAMLSKSEIDQQIATAHRFPRSLKKFRDEAMQMVTLDETIAEECIYALPRKENGENKVIEGPSARFAEIIVSAWGNSRAGARVIDDRGEFVTAQGVFHDLERNVAITYEVQRRITNRQGKRYNADMIGVTANAACSIALRNAILKGVPKAFWASMYDAARKVIMGDIKTLANRRSAAMANFQRFGITPEKVCAQLGVAGVEDITLDHLVTLRGLLTAIKEGDTTPEEAFASAKPAVEMPKSKTDAPKAKPSDAPAAAQDPSREDSGVAEVANQEPSDQEPGIHGLSDSMERLLLEAGRQAGVTREQIIARYGRVDLKNYNEVRADLKDMAEAK